MLSTLAVVFAPGLLAEHDDRSAASVTAAVLAPSADDGRPTVPARTRDALEGTILVAALVAAIAVAAGAGRSTVLRERHLPVSARRERSHLRRRGPPISFA